jgi:hypothetical protein
LYRVLSWPEVFDDVGAEDVFVLELALLVLDA